MGGGRKGVGMGIRMGLGRSGIDGRGFDEKVRFILGI